jgi:hypothetical protein
MEGLGDEETRGVIKREKGKQKRKINRNVKTLLWIQIVQPV